MKKLITLVLALAMVISTALSVSAAGLTADEQKIIDALSAKITTASGTITIPDSYITQAKNFLLSDDSVDAAKATEILAKIDSAKELVKDQPITKISDVPKSIRTDVISLASDAATVVDAKLSVSGNDQVTITKDNKIIFQTSTNSGSTTGGSTTTNPIKQTDTQSNAAAVAVSFVLICGLGVTVIAARKASAK